MCESLAQHRETSLREGNCKVSEKRKSKIIKWPYIDFSNLLLVSSKFHCCDSQICRGQVPVVFFFDFADNLIVTILFHIISFMSENDKLLGLRTPPTPLPSPHTLQNLQFLRFISMTWRCLQRSFLSGMKKTLEEVLLFWYLRLLLRDNINKGHNVIIKMGNLFGCYVLDIIDWNASDQLLKVYMFFHSWRRKIELSFT